MLRRLDDHPDPTRRALLAASATMPMLAAIGLATSGSASGAMAELPPDLAQAMKDYDRATIGNDVATLGRLVADDYVLVNSDSTLQNKQSYLEDFKRPGFRLDPYELSEPVQKAWNDCAIIGGLLPLGWTQDGTHQTRLLRIAHVWIRQDARWRLTYTQLTRVPQ